MSVCVDHDVVLILKDRALPHDRREVFVRVHALRREVVVGVHVPSARPPRALGAGAAAAGSVDLDDGLHELPRASRHVVHTLHDALHGEVHRAGAAREAVDPRGEAPSSQELAQLVGKGEAVPAQPVVVLRVPLLEEGADDEGHLAVGLGRARQDHGFAEPVLLVRPRNLAHHAGPGSLAAPVAPLAAEDLDARVEGSAEGAGPLVQAVKRDQLVHVDEHLLRRILLVQLLRALGQGGGAVGQLLHVLGESAAHAVVALQGRQLRGLDEAVGPRQAHRARAAGGLAPVAIARLHAVEGGGTRQSRQPHHSGAANPTIRVALWSTCCSA
mmetsp:Transcript_23210/g.51499  ORF Transcript_23210/g.51499 Transcript_23210/m.51499 type:complete len:328 (+) Transcript_23210:609-1592(+)